MSIEALQLMREEKIIAELKNSAADRNRIAGLIGGNEQAFNEIFELYHHALYTHVIRFVKSPNLAADIVQDVFIKVWEIRTNIQMEYSFKGFLFTIAKNHMLNVLRKASREEAIKKEILHHALRSHTQNEDDVIYADLNRLADRAIQNLPPQRRVVFAMHSEEGKDSQQIAASLGISKSTVRDHLAKAAKFVKSYLRVNAELTSMFFLLAILN